MLSGIKTGKKKKKQPPVDSCSVAQAPSENLSVAEKLRQALASGDAPQALRTVSSKPVDQLLERGRIVSSTGKSTTHPEAVVLMPSAGTLKRKEEDMTVQELVAQERQNGISWDEQMTRHVVRVGKKRRRKLGASEDSDEEVERLSQALGNSKQQAQSDKEIAKAYHRHEHRLMDEHRQQEKVTSKCSWWVESSSFKQHRLLALGQHLSLVMAPPSGSLVGTGHHFYLVPIKHAASLAEAMDEDPGVWEEVKKFHTSLSNMYARKGKGIVWMETVFTKNKGLWQTKLEMIPVPFSSLQDAPIYFKSAMVEQTEEWGTHNKLLSMTAQKGLANVVPKAGFPYFCIYWGAISTSSNTGYAQIIESDSFRPDFGLDTLAGMLEVDQIRFHRSKKSSHEEERQAIADFLEQWLRVDWTLELDAAKAT